MRSNLGGPPDWGDIDDFDEVSQQFGSLFIAGIASFLVTTVVYSAIFYYVISVLYDADIIGGRIDWTPLCVSVTLLNFARIWDRALLKKR